MTATLNGNSINPVTSGLCPRVFCKYRRRQGDGRAGGQRVQQGTGRTLPQRPLTKHCCGQQRCRRAPVNGDERACQDDRYNQQRGTRRCLAGLWQQCRRDDERHHRGGECADARQAQPDRPVSILVGRHGPRDGPGQQQSDRKVGPEHGPPADQVGDDAADDKTARTGGRTGRAPARDRPFPLRTI
jgi:hypothetical protein